MSERLDALGARIEQLALDPSGITAHAFFRFARPLVALSGWRARVRHEALEGLVLAARSARSARSKGTAQTAPPELRTALDAALEELERNVEVTERAAIVRGSAPVAYASWLRRAWELVALAERAIEERAAADDVRAIARSDRVALLPPLSLATTTEPHDDARVSEIPTRAAAPEAAVDARLVELELGAIDRLVDAARDERALLGRRRRLTIAARRRLLETSAALPLEAAGARARTDAIAGEIARLDRLEHAGIDLEVGLVHQARLAVARRDPRLAFTALAALDGAASSAGDAAVADVTTRALARICPDVDLAGPDAVEASMQRSALDLLGESVLEDVRVTISNARAGARHRSTIAATPAERASAQRAAEQFRAGADVEIAHASVAVDGCFEVGGALTPLRIVEEERVLRQVRPPTETLELVPARDVEDLVDAIVGDPRTILLDLAAGRLLTRRYVREERRETARVIRRSEVRVFLLDGSRSMVGPRARVRDGLMVAELATMIARLSAPTTTRCTLFYRYFDAELGPVTRVDSIAGARAAICDVVGKMRDGATDIQRALLASLEQIAVARELDPELSRAQIVLVTDGDAAVDEGEIDRARVALAGLSVGVSVIALGLENRALRALVARQRARGELAFYHFVDDARLAGIVRGEIDDGVAIHLPVSAEARAEALERALDEEIAPLVEELQAIERTRDLGAMGRLDDEAQARRGAGEASSAFEGALAQSEARSRDRLAVLARYARWFPEAIEASGAAIPAAGAPERDDVDAVVSVLETVAEVVAMIGSGALGRRADAIELVERLLPDARLTPARFRAVLAQWPGAVAASLRAVHAAVGRVM